MVLKVTHWIESEYSLKAQKKRGWGRNLPRAMSWSPHDFFRRARDIMPWHDEPVSPRRQMLNTSSFGSMDYPATSRDAGSDEKSPHSPLPHNWTYGPSKLAGLSIRVQPPSTTAGLILRHCKDGKRIPDSHFPFINRFNLPPESGGVWLEPD